MVQTTRCRMLRKNAIRVILEWVAWEGGCSAIRMWLVIGRRYGVRIKRVMWRMARSDMWNLRYLRILTALARIAVVLPTPFHSLSTFAPTTFSAVTSSSVVLLQHLGFGLASSTLVFLLRLCELLRF